MAPYNDYSSSLSSSRLSSYTTPTRTYSGTERYTSTSTPSSYRYKPPIFSSTLSSKYRSPSAYSTPSTYVPSTPSTLPRNFSSSYLSSRVPKFNSVSSYTSAVLNSSDYKYKSPSTINSDLLYRSPSLSRRNSSSSLIGPTRTPERSLSRASLPAFPVSTESTPTYKVNSWSCDKLDDSSEKHGTRVGLNNLGNTCFMNAVLQCLCHTQPLVDYCTRGSFMSDINHRSPTHGDLMKAFAAFVKKISDPKLNCSFSPHELRREVQRYAPRFCGDHQQDAQEFLRYLLQGLHDDINRVKFKPTRRDDSGGDAYQIWRKYKETDDSLVVDLFAGQLKSTLKCTICNNESITYDPFWDLSLPIPEGYRDSSLRSCFNLFSSPEYLDGSNKPYCEICKKKSRSSKKIEVNKFPKVLVIHLKRFSATSYGQKLNMMIDCPLILSNVSEFASKTCTGDGCPYALYGVVDHDGSNNSGHYTAKCRNPITKEWNEFNDSRVTKATNVVTSKSYILFYIQEGSSIL